MSDYDAIIIGGGHNGLILGNYLVRAGLKTLILERRSEVGGGLSTEEITIPGFLHNLHSYFHDTINVMPAFIDLDLEKLNARYYRPPVQAGIVSAFRDVLKYSNNSIVQMKTCFFRYLLSSFYCVAHRRKRHVKSF